MIYVNKKLNVCAHIYNFFIKIGSNLQSLFLLYWRLTWGFQFFLAGIGKVFNMDKAIQYFVTLNIPSPVFSAYLVSYVEMICGLLLIIGFASRLITLPLIIVMMTAMGTAHSHVFGGCQFLLEPHTFLREAPYPYLMSALIIFIFGPGRLSLDAWIKRWVENQPRY